MTDYLHLDHNALAYDVTGQGPLVVLAHGIGDSRHAYRFVAPALAAAGYRVANVDIRGCGESSLGWDGYSRTDIAGDLVALVRHLGGGPAVIIGHSISGGAATIAAATAPELVAGLVELAPFTRAQSYPIGALLRVKRYRSGVLHLTRTLMTGSLTSWKKYLDLAYPTKPADWDAELARIDGKLREPGRMEALQSMCKSKPTDAGEQLAQRPLPRARRRGQRRPRLGRPARRRAEDHRRPAGRPRRADRARRSRGTTRTPRSPTRSSALTLPFLAKVLRDA